MNEHFRYYIDAAFKQGDLTSLQKILDFLTDRVGEDESHELAPLMDYVGTLVERLEAPLVEVVSA